MDLMTYLLAIQKIQEVSSDTTYTLTADVQNKTIVLTPSVGTAQIITVPYATDASTVNGKNVPELENGKIPASYLPSYVDDVEEYEDQEHFPSTGESNKIYIDLTTNKIYRWSGTTYVEISESLALGETSSTAFRGDHGKTAYNHSLITSGNPHNVTKTDIGLDNVGNFKAVSTVASQGLTTTEQENAKANIGLGVAADKDIDISIEESSQSTNLPTTKAVSDFVQTQTDKVVGTIKSVSNLPAPIASFSGAAALPMPKLEVAIEPVQDLHGYDSPWVGGAGKNKFQTTATSKTQNGVTWTVNNDGTITVSGSATNYTDLILGTAKVTTSMGEVTISGISGTTNIAWNNIALRDANNNVLYLIASGGTYASFTVDLSQYPTADNIVIGVKRNNNGAISGTIKPQVELGQAVTTYEPYSNICPIIGWDEVNVGVSGGEDILDLTQANYTSKSEYGVTITFNSDNSVTINGTTTAQSQIVWTFNYSIASNFKGKFLAGINDCTLLIEQASSPYSKWAIVEDGDTGKVISENINNAANLIIRIPSGKTFNNRAIKPIIYDVQTYTIDLDGTRYGGKVDVVSGSGTDDRGYIVFDGSSDENWVVQGTAGFFIDVSDKKAGMGNYIANNYKATNSSGWDDRTPINSFSGHPTLSRLYFRYPYEGFSADLTAWRAWLASNNVQVVYELATPLTIQLTPTVVKSLLVSNVWSDTGNILDAQYISYEYDKICAKYSENIIPTDDFTLNTTTGDITTDGDIIRKNGYWGGTYGGTHTSLIDAIDDLYNLIQQNNS